MSDSNVSANATQKMEQQQKKPTVYKEQNTFGIQKHRCRNAAVKPNDTDAVRECVSDCISLPST